MKKTIRLLAVAICLLFSLVSVEANNYKITIRKPSNSHLKSLCYAGDTSMTHNGIEFECYTTGVYEINVTDEDGNIIYYQKLYARAGRTYFIYIPGLNPDEDVME